MRKCKRVITAGQETREPGTSSYVGPVSTVPVGSNVGVQYHSRTSAVVVNFFATHSCMQALNSADDLDLPRLQMVMWWWWWW